MRERKNGRKRRNNRLCKGKEGKEGKGRIISARPAVLRVCAKVGLSVCLCSLLFLLALFLRSSCVCVFVCVASTSLTRFALAFFSLSLTLSLLSTPPTFSYPRPALMIKWARPHKAIEHKSASHSTRSVSATSPSANKRETDKTKITRNVDRPLFLLPELHRQTGRQLLAWQPSLRKVLVFFQSPYLKLCQFEPITLRSTTHPLKKMYLFGPPLCPSVRLSVCPPPLTL